MHQRACACNYARTNARVCGPSYGRARMFPTHAPTHTPGRLPTHSRWHPPRRKTVIGARAFGIRDGARVWPLAASPHLVVRFHDPNRYVSGSARWNGPMSKLNVITELPPNNLLTSVLRGVASRVGGAYCCYIDTHFHYFTLYKHAVQRIRGGTNITVGCL